jgi:undecaprenyl-diphosphatase
MSFIEILKVLFIGLVEGITEWLPISSTGHMILVNEFIKLNITSEFKEMFLVVIQLGAILAALSLFFNKLYPFNKPKEVRKDTYSLWLKIIISCVPAGVIGILFDDWVFANFYNSIVVSLALIVYGILFIYIEKKEKKPIVESFKDISYKTALFIGLFQVLSIIPGTSRSGATIVGGLLLGINRVVITEYTFMLALPVMFGASFVKLLDFGLNFTNTEFMVLAIGMITAFIVSLFSIKLLLEYIKKNDFKAFGWYRIILGIIVLLYFIIF